MTQSQFLCDQTPQRLAHHVCRTHRDRLEPAGDVVGHIGRRVCTIRAVALSCVARVKCQRTIPRPEMAERPAECPIVPPIPLRKTRGTPC